MKPFEELLASSAEAHPWPSLSGTGGGGAHGAHFEDAREITWQDMNWSPVARLRREERERSQIRC
jgi:hypothetical protein